MQPGRGPEPTPSPTAPSEAPAIVCVGELLWDSLPTGLFLGGAPFNVSAHLRALGLDAKIVSRVGDDQLGREAVRRVGLCGLSADCIQVDARLATGFVAVQLNAEGMATYEILAPAAWDAIEMDERTIAAASRAQVLVFGSLAQRDTISRATIRRLSESSGFRVFDVNLRRPYDDVEVVRASLESADLVKLNEEEMRRLGVWFGLPDGLEAACRALSEAFGGRTICVTRGADGAALLRRGCWTEVPGFRVQVADTVGAGDAFLAALLHGWLAGDPDERMLQQANLLGAFVAAQSGAVPAHDADAIAGILRQSVRPLVRRGG